MTMTTNQGVVEVQLDVGAAPCTAASFSYLASKQFFNNTKCHRLTDSGLYVLQCGDPTGTGAGGPAYNFADENLPAAVPEPTPNASAAASPSNSPGAPMALYRAGMVVMANSGANTNSSQFFIVYKDSKLEPKYSIAGTVTKGLDVVEKIAAAGIRPGGTTPNDGQPKNDVIIQSLTVGASQTSGPSSEPSGSPVPGASGSPAPGASGAPAPATVSSSP